MLDKLQTIFRQEGFSAIPRRALNKLRRDVGSRYEEALARRKGTYHLEIQDSSIRIIPRLNATALINRLVEECIPERVAQHYLEHRFDLLGSGWVRVGYGMRCRGMAGYRYDMGERTVPDTRGEWLAGRINFSNLPVAQRIWGCVDVDYQPLDWQLDFKSGYRWSEATWARRLKFGHLLGVDVKVPWELSRMQHHPQLALRAACIGTKDAQARRLAREIRNQWLDFIATNPPGFGVNWVCPMDIAIRAANWCLAWDIMQAAGFALDPEDEVLLGHSLYDHGQYIVRHLEWSSERGNHYLADICGLIFIAAYLPESVKINRWLAFAIGQLQQETLRQFLPDGGNFEGSTAYHRLSTEMVLYATALTLGLPQDRLERLEALEPTGHDYLSGSAGMEEKWTRHNTGIDAALQSIDTPFPLEYIERLQLAVSFFAAILKPNGTFPQVGDNDSGRFFKVQPVYKVMTVGEAKNRFINLEVYNELDSDDLYYFEDVLNGDHLLNVAKVSGIKDHATEFGGLEEPSQYAMEQSVVAGLSCGNAWRPIDSFWGGKINDADEINHGINFLRQCEVISRKSRVKKFTYPLPRPTSISTATVKVAKFEDFGCYIFHHVNFYLLVRCNVKSGSGKGGHSHYDQLSVELNVDGKCIVRDPGSYVYTALPEDRNRYRSALAHFSPIWTSSSAENTSAIFSPSIGPLAAIDYCGCNGFAAHVNGMIDPTAMLVCIEPRAITLMHVNSSDSEHALFPEIKMFPFSPGYGIQERESA